MKIFIFISIIVLAMILVKSASAKTENQKYDVIYKQGDFEIRFYPQAILASVDLNGTYDDSRNSGFRILAGYIFGRNKQEQKIAMTAPVRMSNGEGQKTMSFVLPSKMQFDSLPEPINEKIVLHKSESVYSASIRYGGYTNNKEIEKKKKELIKILKEFNLVYKDNFEYLGYNPPYQIVNRRNEILVELDKFDPQEFKTNKQ